MPFAIFIDLGAQPPPSFQTFRPDTGDLPPFAPCLMELRLLLNPVAGTTGEVSPLTGTTAADRITGLAGGDGINGGLGTDQFLAGSGDFTSAR